MSRPLRVWPLVLVVAVLVVGGGPGASGLSPAIADALTAPAQEAARPEEPPGPSPAELFWPAINFAILAGALYAALRRPVQNFLLERRATISRRIEEATEARAAAEARHREYRERLARAQQAVEEILRHALVDAREEAARLEREAQRAAERIRRQAQLTVEQEVRQARAVLADEVAARCLRLAEELLRAHLQPADHERLQARYLERLAALPAGATGGGR
ncbi:MAG: ATP synthase F0 subunit B [Deltaproteobacteria bacterium]|nr:ATP synthase F0 subunit B [Deltaproteobacteria bacterium]